MTVPPQQNGTTPVFDSCRTEKNCIFTLLEYCAEIKKSETLLNIPHG
jgi:hypothetical protein